jgi:hypothetical protein
MRELPAVIARRYCRFSFRGEADMQRTERRKCTTPPAHALERQLNEVQRMTLRELERFGLSLTFVRRPLFQAPVGVVVDGQRQLVIEPDGSTVERTDVKRRN